MDANIDYNKLHEIDKAAILLISHLKLANVDCVDVLLLAQVIKSISNFPCELPIRETIYGYKIADIDSMLMSLYLFGYLKQETREITLTLDYIRSNVVTHFDESTNSFYEFVANEYVKLKPDEPEYNGNYIGNLLYNYNVNGHNDRK